MRCATHDSIAIICASIPLFRERVSVMTHLRTRLQVKAYAKRHHTACSQREARVKRIFGMCASQCRRDVTNDDQIFSHRSAQIPVHVYNASFRMSTSNATRYHSNIDWLSAHQRCIINVNPNNRQKKLWAMLTYRNTFHDSIVNELFQTKLF